MGWRGETRRGVVVSVDDDAGSGSSSGSTQDSNASVSRVDVIEAEYVDVASSIAVATDDDTEGGWRWRPPRGKGKGGGGGDGGCEFEPREESPPQWELGCSTKLSMRVQVPRPLSFAPSFLLGGAFSVIACAVMQAILPRFVEFLAADYKRYANGEDREAPVGSFVKDEGSGSGSGSGSGAGGSEDEAESLVGTVLVK